ncbi:MAG TPA: metalloregulator ArsR/SmtB family transcription factor [Candidatus Hungatella pullicola]|nr:metalloregulator ArsR/SmtB family transcription factor [Candidatus Hungatella pullicola]
MTLNSKKTDCIPWHEELILSVREKMPPQPSLFHLSDFFRVIGDNTRIQILWALDNSEMCVGDLAVLLNMTKSAVSHQLKILRLSKLVQCRREGRQVFYSLSDDHIRIILELAMVHINEQDK